MTELRVFSRAGEQPVSYDTGEQTAWVVYDTCAISYLDVAAVLRQVMPWWPFSNHRRVRFLDTPPTSVSREIWAMVDQTPVRFDVTVSNNYAFGMTEEELEALWLKVVQKLRTMLRKRVMIR